MRNVMIFLCLFGFMVSIFQPVLAEEVPVGVVEEAQRGLELWRKGSLTDLEDMKITYNMSEEELKQMRLGTPTVRYLIRSESLKTCKTGADILNTAVINHYSFPVISGTGIKAFISVRPNSEIGEPEYLFVGVGPGDEGDSDYRILENKYKEEDGYDIQFLLIDWPSKYFLLVRDNQSKYFLAPISDYAISMVKSTRYQLIPLSDALPKIFE